MLRIAVKYKAMFNLISDRIKDKIKGKPTKEESFVSEKTKRGGKRLSK